jgi:hypothetical protein
MGFRRIWYIVQHEIFKNYITVAIILQNFSSPCAPNYSPKPVDNSAASRTDYLYNNVSMIPSATCG